MNFTEQFVPRGQHRIYAREYAGAEPTIVLMHGFPDNLHLYDRLVPFLSPQRRVVTFDFLGWGSSDKPAGYAYTATNQEADLNAVVKQLALRQVVLVAHDASGPPAIDWALGHSDQVAALVLLNTYYCAMAMLRPPEAILPFWTSFHYFQWSQDQVTAIDSSRVTFQGRSASARRFLPRRPRNRDFSEAAKLIILTVITLSA